MSAKPLDPASPGGRAPILAGRVPQCQHERVLAAIHQHELSISEFLRNATEAELERLDAELTG